MIALLKRQFQRAVWSAIATYASLLVLLLIVLLAGCATNGGGLIPEHASPPQCIRWQQEPGLMVARDC
jgi:hypothetical protein